MVCELIEKSENSPFLKGKTKKYRFFNRSKMFVEQKNKVLRNFLE